jgi:hypothetical protein
VRGGICGTLISLVLLLSPPPIMSSAQVVGLVLGAIPLVISGLEHYKNTVSVIAASSQHAKLEIEQIKEELVYQRLLLQDTLKVLLPKADLHEFLSDPTSSKWQSEEIESLLRQSLGDEYSIFASLVSRLFDAVSSVENSLRNITDPSKSNRSISLSSLRWALSSRNKTRQSLHELEFQNQMLRALAQTAAATKTTKTRQRSDIISSTQAIQNIHTSLKTFLEVQEVAQNVENLISGATGAAQDDDDDLQSVYSVESEVGLGCSNRNLRIR